tara:strand:+ start:314 stop:505 length:192 start_codon:yes stop_codon:yes gene_type:complete
MRINEKTINEFRDSYKVSISMKHNLDLISRNYYGYNFGELNYTSEQRNVIGTYLKVLPNYETR